MKKKTKKRVLKKYKDFKGKLNTAILIGSSNTKTHVFAQNFYYKHINILK